jgi:hypothetical protein
VAPNPKRLLDPEDEKRIRSALSAREKATDEVRDAVLAASDHGASVRVLAEFTGMSTNTISRWKAERK